MTEREMSTSPYRVDLIPPKAILEMAAVFKHDAEKYGEDNWRKLGIETLLNHMLVHAFAYLAGDRSDDHLSHIASRAIMALAQEIEPVGPQPPAPETVEQVRLALVRAWNTKTPLTLDQILALSEMLDWDKPRPEGGK